MSEANYQDYFLQAFQELHKDGNEWIYLPDVAQLAARHDETFMRRRTAINKALGFIGIHRPDLPSGHFYPPRGGLYPLIARMEHAGLVEGEFEEGDYPRRRMYKLVGVPQEE